MPTPLVGGALTCGTVYRHEPGRRIGRPISANPHHKSAFALKDRHCREPVFSRRVPSGGSASRIQTVQSMKPLPAFLTFFSIIQIASAAEQRKPNILLIVADDLGYGELGLQGFTKDIPTPNIDS